MTIIEILNYVNTSLKSSFAGAVEAIKKHTFSVKFPDIQKVSLKFPDIQKVTGKVDVKFPDVQRVGGKVEVINLPALGGIIEKLEDIRDELSKKGVEVTNFPEFPKKIEISNLPEEKELNFVGLESKLDVLISSIKKLPTKFPDFPKLPDYPTQKPITFPKSFEVSNLGSLKSSSPKDYVPVRLTDGDEFYKAIEEFYQQVSSAVTFTESDGKKSSALVDADRHVQVDVLTMPEIVIPAVTGGATEAKQDDIIEAIENKVIPIATEIEVNNFPTTFPLPAEQIEALTPPTPTPAITGFSTSAKQDTLAGKIDLLLTELEQKTEPSNSQTIETIIMLRSILMAIANPSYVDKSANQIRAQVTGSVTATLASTTISTIDSYQGKLLMVGINNDAWANTCRRLIT